MPEHIINLIKLYELDLNQALNHYMWMKAIKIITNDNKNET